MTPAFHLLMPFKRVRRYGGVATLVLLPAMLGWFLLTLDLELSKWVSLTGLGGLLLALLGTEALAFLKPGLSARNGFTITAGGLSLRRNARVAEWRWDEISDLRIRSRLHPASLFLGRFISFRVPRDDRRSAFGHVLLPGSVAAIGDDYSSRIDDLFQQIEHYRDGAGVADSKPAHRPEPVWSLRKDRKQPKLLSIILLVLGPPAGALIGMVLIDGFPDSIGQIFDSSGIVGALGGAAGLLPLMILMQFKLESGQDNMLVMSAGGLHTRHKIEMRYWRWHEISEMRIEQSATRGEDGGAATILNFLALHDGSDPGKKQKPGEEAPISVSCSIEDNYDTPVEEIARQARAWWEWSGETFGHSVAAAGQSTADSSRTPRAVAFLRQPSQLKGRGSPLESIVPFIFLTPMLACTGGMIWMLKADINLGIPWWVTLPVLAVLMFGSMLTMIAVMLPGSNRLELNADGLLHVRFARKRRWPWHAVGSAELRRVRSKWSAKSRSVITIPVPADSWSFRFLRWAFNIDGDRAQAVIEDIYETPLDEIAATLNDHRSRQR